MDQRTFETRLMNDLMDRRVNLLTCDAWDHDEKTDFKVTQVDGAAPRHHLEVQATRQGGNLHKLQRFVRISDERPDVIRLYLVYAYTLWPNAAAEATKLILRKACRDGFPPGPHGFFINTRHHVDRFNPRQRISYLEKRLDPKNPRRIRGVIKSGTYQNFTVRGDDGLTYLGLMGDSHGPLAMRLKSGPVGRIKIAVTFVPYTEHHGHKTGTLRALSVTLAS